MLLQQCKGKLSMISKLERKIEKIHTFQQNNCAHSRLYVIWITLTTNTINSAMILSEDELAR